MNEEINVVPTTHDYEKKGEIMHGNLETQMLGGTGYAGGFGGIAPLGLFGLVGLNNGLGFGNNAAVDAGLSQRITDLQIAGVNQNINSAEANLSQAILTQTNNLGSLIYGASADGINTTRSVGEVLGAQTAGVKDVVQNSMFQQALFGKDFALSQCAQTSELKDAIIAQGEMTRAQMTADTIQALREDKQALQDELALTLRVGPPAVGAFMTTERPNFCSQNQATSQIEIINQNVNAIGSVVSQLATQIQGLTTK